MGVNTTEVISRVIKVNSLQSEGPEGEPGGKTGEGPAQGQRQDGDVSNKLLRARVFLWDRGVLRVDRRCPKKQKPKNNLPVISRTE